MSHDEQDRWQELVDRLEDEANPAALARAESALQSVEPHFVSPAWIEGTIERAVRPAPRSAPTRRRWLAAASVLLLGMLAAAATKVLVWPGEQNSLEELNYDGAVMVLRSPERGDEARMVGLARLVERIEVVIRALRAVQSAADASPPLRAQAEQLLAGLTRALSSGAPGDGRLVGDDLRAATARLQDAQVDELERLQLMQRIEGAARHDLMLMWSMPESTPRLRTGRDTAIRRLLGRLR